MIEITDEMVTIARRHSIVLTSAVAKDLLAAVAPLIAAQEREACAKLCDAEATNICHALCCMKASCANVAAAITGRRYSSATLPRSST